MSPRGADGAWDVVPMAGAPAGALVCLGCGALVLLDDGAVQAHRWLHQALDRIADLVLTADQQTELGGETR